MSKIASKKSKIKGKARRKTIHPLCKYFSQYELEDLQKAVNRLPNKMYRDLFDIYRGADIYCECVNAVSEENAKKFHCKIIPAIRNNLMNMGLEVQVPTDTDEQVLEVSIEEQLIDLVKSGKNNNEICKILNVDYKELYRLLLELKNRGIMNYREYYYNGVIVYRPFSSAPNIELINPYFSEKTIVTDSNEDNFKCLVFSDLHFGNELERLDLVNKAFNYCSKNNINIILACGDLIDGTSSRGEQRITDSYEQVEYFLNNYPYDKNILTFSVAGDHDRRALSQDSVSLFDACNNYRHDVVVSSFNKAKINVKNEGLYLCHDSKFDIPNEGNYPIVLNGHLHKYQIDIIDNILNVYVPSLSNILHSMPTVLELEIGFSNGYINNVSVRQIYLGEKDVLLGETNYDLSNRHIKYDSPINVADLSSGRKNPNLSRTEKFNSRYHIG